VKPIPWRILKLPGESLAMYRIFFPYDKYRRAADQLLYIQVKAMFEKAREDPEVSAR